MKPLPLLVIKFFNPLIIVKMIQYEVQLNQGNEALQTGKTITANEVLLTCDEKARLYIMTDCGGFEKFSEWGMIRAKDI